jgi:hypothetical protein
MTCTLYIDRISGKCVDSCEYITDMGDAPHYCESTSDSENCPYQEMMTNGSYYCRTECTSTQIQYGVYCMNTCDSDEFIQDNVCSSTCSSEVFVSYSGQNICIEQDDCSLGLELTYNIYECQ